MPFVNFKNIWIWIYSFNISLLFTGWSFFFLPSWRHLIFLQGNLFLVLVFFILLNVIVYGICYRLMSSCLLRPMFLDWCLFLNSVTDVKADNRSQLKLEVKQKGKYCTEQNEMMGRIGKACLFNGFCGLFI
jgi:hypothetical protein